MTLDDLRAALRRLRDGEIAIPPEEAANVAGLLATAQAAVVVRAAAASAPRPIAPPAPEERKSEPLLLSAAAAARLLGVSRWWLYENADIVPAVLLKGKGKRVRRKYSPARLRRWMEERGR